VPTARRPYWLMRSRDLAARSPRSTPIVAGSASDAKSRRDLAMASTSRLQFDRRRLGLSPNMSLARSIAHGARQSRDHVELEPQLDMQVEHDEQADHDPGVDDEVGAAADSAKAASEVACSGTQTK